MRAASQVNPYQPAISAQFSAVGTNENTRLATGVGASLTNPLIISHVGAAVYGVQLVTDFGRANRLMQASQLRAEADQSASRLTRAQVLLQVRTAFHQLVRRQRLEQLAERNASRAGSQEAQLQLLLARNERTAAAIDLATVMGERAPQIPVAVTPERVASASDAMPPDASALIEQALKDSPEAQQRRQLADAALAQVSADRRAALPTINAVATAGWVPLKAARFPPRDFYQAAGVNVAIPLFGWKAMHARADESRLRAEAARQQLRDTENRIARNIAVTALQLSSAGANAAMARQRLARVATEAERATVEAQLAQAEFEVAVQRATLDFFVGGQR